MTKIIGLTGGIGSGKSTVAKHYASLGIPVYIADDEARELMNKTKIIGKIIDIFGKEIISDGKINRKKLSEIVFQQPPLLEKLNSIIHPEVNLHFKNWVKKHQDFPFVIKEAAILFESGSYKDCDKIIMITAPKNIRIARVMNRDKVSQEAVLRRMKQQWPEEKKIEMSDFVIQNINIQETLRNSERILSLL
ncbi:dephospho-CoA kinase [Flavobacterium sp. NST-5]|uniref:Dephospho-CoA kinase n=1 Tax=Flavobacterium ichthyis TaxID=2698827 RepID=A0ABW9Z6K1_9FLAO|nr:dephospho-CoA kinase [Flavobacterium ichthyis]NBL64274.1 dephospho-CoA kinase [Flavobacterium ichthyis]